MGAPIYSSVIRIAWYIHPFRFGGMERFLLRLVQHLDPEKVQIIALFDSPGEVADKFSSCGITSQILPAGSFRESFRSLTEILVEHKFDAIQTNMFTPLPAIAAAHVGISHVWRIGGHPDVALRRMSLYERKEHLEIIAMQSAAIICNSNFVAKPFSNLCGPSPTVIRNGIEIDTTDQVESRFTHHSLSAPQICMLAHFDSQKRHEDLIHAAKHVRNRLPGARFNLFGSTFGEESMIAYRQSLQEMINTMGLADIIEIKTTDDARAELLKSHISVMPSINESSSNAILESMAYSTPVIAADSGGNKEIIDSAINGILVKPYSPVHLANSILDIAQDPLLAQRLIFNARQRVHLDYNISNSARRYEEFYKRVLTIDGVT